MYIINKLNERYRGSNCKMRGLDLKKSDMKRTGVCEEDARDHVQQQRNRVNDFKQLGEKMKEMKINKQI